MRFTRADSYKLERVLGDIIGGTNSNGHPIIRAIGEDNIIVRANREQWGKNHRALLVKGKGTVLYDLNLYYGKRPRKNRLSDILGMVLDVDDISDNDLRVLEEYWKQENIPSPNFVVSSGNGIHIGYLFDEPMKMRTYKPDLFQEKILRGFYDVYFSVLGRFTKTNRLKNQKDKYLPISQGFRSPLERTKKGDLVTSCLISKKPYSTRFLIDFIREDKRVLPENRINDKQITFLLTDKEGSGQKKYRANGLGYLHPNSYHNYLNKILTEWTFEEGHRFYTLRGLVILGAKCNIPQNQIIEDLEKAYTHIKNKTTYKSFGREVIRSALGTTFKNNEDFIKTLNTSRRWVYEKISQEAPRGSKRNGRTQGEHLSRIREKARLVRTRTFSERTKKKQGRLEKDIFELYQENKTQREISEILGCSLGKVNKTLGLSLYSEEELLGMVENLCFSYLKRHYKFPSSRALSCLFEKTFNHSIDRNFFQKNLSLIYLRTFRRIDDWEECLKAAVPYMKAEYGFNYLNYYRALKTQNQKTKSYYPLKQIDEGFYYCLIDKDKPIKKLKHLNRIEYFLRTLTE